MLFHNFSPLPVIAWLFLISLRCSTIHVARVSRLTGKCFDLGCCGCLYCLLRSCVLTVSERQKVLWDVFYCLIVAMCFCQHLGRCGIWLARERFDTGSTEQGGRSEPSEWVHSLGLLSSVNPISNHSLANHIPQLPKCQQKHMATIKHIINSS